MHSFKHYLEELSPAKPSRQQTPAEMLSILRAIKAAKETDVN